MCSLIHKGMSLETVKSDKMYMIYCIFLEGQFFVTVAYVSFLTVPSHCSFFVN